MRRFADALPDPCLILDRRAIIVHRNPLAAQAVSRRLRRATRSPSRCAQPAMLERPRGRATRTGEPQSVELHQTVPIETWHQVSVAPLAGEAGAISS